MGDDFKNQPRSIEDFRRYQSVLDLLDLMAHQGSLPELFHELAERLRDVVSFDFINFALHDEKLNVMRLHLWEGLRKPSLPKELPMEEAPSGWVWEHQQPLMFCDISQENRFAVLFHLLSEEGIRSYCMLPMSTPQHRLGGLGFGSSKMDAYTDEDLEFLTRVSKLVALAVENSLGRQALTEEKNRWQALVEVNNSLNASLKLEELLPVISSHLGRVVPHDYAGVAVYNPEKRGMEAYSPAFPTDGGQDGNVTPLDQSLAGQAFLARETKYFRRDDLAKFHSSFAERMLDAGIQSMCSIPLMTSKSVLGTLNVGSRREDGFSERDQGLLHQIAKQLAVSLENARAYLEIAGLKDKLAGEKLYLQDEIRTELNFEEIIGAAANLKFALSQASTVAPSGATALILGETGTGKELIARAIHQMSGRRDHSFIKLNCAAIPTGLLESELFGHEKGAFTGAITQKVGRLELADQGTLFLDEVGDIPLELQPKLLRVLQDQEFERLGSNRTIRVSVRLIAATNRDLSKLVAERQFRSDLYYRLNVFPIRVPPLRERRKDIPLLVRYFVQRLSRRMNKTIESIPSETMSALVSWDWPGNVRELENFIERSVILSTGPTLKVPLSELTLEEQPAKRDTKLETAEREHILKILRETGGVISGPRGAASRLGLKRTTLQSKMHKLRISRQDFQN